MEHLSPAELEAGLDHVREAPADSGTLKLIVRRPAENQREVIAEGALDLVTGLVGDNWMTRGSSSTPDGSAHPDAQITMMNARAALLVVRVELVPGQRAAALVAGHEDRKSVCRERV